MMSLPKLISASLLCAAASPALAAPTESTAYLFSSQLSGAFPGYGLIGDSTGALYGVTTIGGAAQVGVVFKLTPPPAGKTKWSEQVLHGFSTASLGTYPFAGLASDAAGNLYGTTLYGGANMLGVLYRLAPPKQAGGKWTETVLYNFTQTDGAPDLEGPLLVSSGGTLYGSSVKTVFSLTPPATTGKWVHKVLFTFKTNNQGSYPSGGLIQDQAGNLYGVTATGGAHGVGVVFKLAAPAWTESVLYAFTGGNDGADPLGGVTLTASGELIGTTSTGGATGSGTIFTLTPKATAPWSFSLLHSFKPASDGATPVTRLVADSSGNYYGTAAGGGITLSGTGATQCVDSLSEIEIYYVLSSYSFSTTGCGTVFEITPPAAGAKSWAYTTLNKFNGYAVVGTGGQGASPFGPVAIDTAGNLYGSVVHGLDSGGAVFKITP